MRDGGAEREALGAAGVAGITVVRLSLIFRAAALGRFAAEFRAYAASAAVILDQKMGTGRLNSRKDCV